MWGAILGAASSLIGADAKAKEADKKKRALSRYRQAYDQYANYGQQEGDELTAATKQAQLDRFTRYNMAGTELNGAGRVNAGDAGGQEYLGQLDQAMAPIRPGFTPAVQAGGMSGWGARAAAKYQPRLLANRAQLQSSGVQSAQSDFDANIFNQLQEGDVNTSRQTNEQRRKAGLLEAFRNQQLAKWGTKVGYKGPGNGYYNQELAAGLLGTAARFDQPNT